MDLSDLRALTLQTLDDPAGTYFTQPVLDLRLNLAAKETQKRLLSANKEYYLKCLKTDTVIGQQAYSLPDDFIRMLRLEWYLPGQVSSTQSTMIYPITPNQRDLVGSVQSQYPQLYSFAKNNIILWPIPQTVVEMHIEYSYLIADMVNASDVPDVPDQFQEYISILVARDGLIQDGRPLGPLQTKLDAYEVLFKQIADQRNMDVPRMVVQTQATGFEGGFNW